MNRAADLFAEPLFRPKGRPKPKGIPVTVCIAAHCGQHIVCASDRMLTSGDVQFEPNRQKIYALTPSVVVMTAGDTSGVTMVLGSLMLKIADFQTKKGETPRISDIVGAYADGVADLRGAMAEDALLMPLGLTRATFLERQATMEPELVRKLTAGILDFDIEPFDVIIAGRDNDGSSLIYTAQGSHVQNMTTVGFAAIGIGARHAESQMMLNRYTWNSSLSDGLLQTYFAKKRAEVAPGVGKETDIVVIQPNAPNGILLNDTIKARLQQEYEKVVLAEVSANNAAKTEIAKFTESIFAQPIPPPPVPNSGGKPAN